ncbi:hypothetical protein [Actinoplanes sp. URMC 104]|uniref:hypothetical protein n=1 Tax=Actinoplanes sp. URMC 104 TaxID=3423409 RepID=UPI003F1B5919
MSWWSGQSKEIKVALIGGVFTLAAAGVGVISDRASPAADAPAGTSSPAADPAYCLALLERLDQFLDRDPRNGRVFLHKGADGKPVVTFGPAARSCGIDDPAVLSELAGAGQPAR